MVVVAPFRRWLLRAESAELRLAWQAAFTAHIAAADRRAARLRTSAGTSLAPQPPVHVVSDDEDEDSFDDDEHARSRRDDTDDDDAAADEADVELHDDNAPVSRRHTVGAPPVPLKRRSGVLSNTVPPPLPTKRLSVSLDNTTTVNAAAPTSPSTRDRRSRATVAAPPKPQPDIVVPHTSLPALPRKSRNMTSPPQRQPAPAVPPKALPALPPKPSVAVDSLKQHQSESSSAHDNNADSTTTKTSSGDTSQRRRAQAFSSPPLKPLFGAKLEEAVERSPFSVPAPIALLVCFLFILAYIFV